MSKSLKYIRGTKTLGVEISQLFHGEGDRNDMQFMYWCILVSLVTAAFVQCCDMSPNTYSLQYSLSWNPQKV